MRQRARPPRRPARALILAALALAACGDDPVTPDPTPTLDGYWRIADNPELWGFYEASMAFAGDGTLTLDGLVRVDGQSELVSRVGSWSATPELAFVVLRLDGEATTWELVFADQRVLFLGTGDDPRWFRLARFLPD